VPTIDLVSSALDALADHLTETIPGLTARRGWPEANTALDIDEARHVAAVIAGPPEYTLVSPRSVKQTGSTLLAIQYRVAEVEIPVQLDLWCAYRATRDDLVPLVETALHNRMPFQAGLWLSSAKYYGRPLTIETAKGGGSRFQDAPDAVARGEWRKTWDLTIRTDMVVEAEHPAMLTAAIRAAVTSLGTTITEADVEVS
jgi:hypothetical protein